MTLPARDRDDLQLIRARIGDAAAGFYALQNPQGADFSETYQALDRLAARLERLEQEPERTRWREYAKEVLAYDGPPSPGRWREMARTLARRILDLDLDLAPPSSGERG